jgi:hypothetical protein
MNEPTILDCGHAPSEHSHCTTGYGELNGKRYCYDCCTAQDKQAISDAKASEGFVAYLNSDCTRVTNWPGRELGRVFSKRKAYNAMARGYRLNIRVKMFDGSIWFATACAGGGMYCRLRKTKQSTPADIVTA